MAGFVGGIGGSGGGKDGFAGGEQVNGRGTEAREVPALVGARRSTDGHQIGKGQAGGVVRGKVGIGEIVAGGGGHNQPIGGGGKEGIGKAKGEFGTTPAEVQDMRAVGPGELDARNGIGVEAIAGRIKEFADHQPRMPRGPGNPPPIVAHRADNPRKVGAVPVVVPGIRPFSKGIEAGRPIDGMSPEVGGEIFVGGTDAGVEDGNNDIGGRPMEFPGLGRVEVGIGKAIVLPIIVEPPLGAVLEVGIIGKDRGRGHREIGFGPGDEWVGLATGEGRLDGLAFGTLDQLQTAQPGKLAEHPATVPGVVTGQGGVLGGGPGQDEDASGMGLRCDGRVEVKGAEQHQAQECDRAGTVWNGEAHDGRS